MNCLDDLLKGAPGFCLAKPGDTYLLLLKDTSKAAKLEIDGEFTVQWFNPRTGGDLKNGSNLQIQGNGPQLIGDPPSEKGKDWVVLVQKAS